MGKHQRDVPRSAIGAEVEIKLCRGFAMNRRKDMGRGPVPRFSQAIKGLRLSGGIQKANIVVLEQEFRVAAAGQFGEDTEGQIDLAIDNRANHPFAAFLRDHEINAGRLPAQGTHQPRKQQGRAVVGHRKAEDVTLGRIEALGCKHGADLRQRLGQGGRQFQRTERGFHLAPASVEQRVAKQDTQARKRMADCGLAHVQALGGPRQMPLGQKRIKHDEKIEIDRTQIIHAAHIMSFRSNFKCVSRSGSRRENRKDPAMPSFFLVIIAALAGAAVPFQGGANAALGRALGHPLWATLASLAVSALCILPVLMILRVPLPTLGGLGGQPKWIWIGGIAGVVYVTAAILLMPKLGAASFMIAVIAGQIVAALVIDWTGGVGLAARPVDATRLAGTAMVLLGAIVVQWPVLSR